MSSESDFVTSSTVALCDFGAVAVFVRLASCAADVFDVQPMLITSSDNWGFFCWVFVYISLALLTHYKSCAALHKQPKVWSSRCQNFFDGASCIKMIF